ncbi:hypothetical protein WA026_015020 [Henosepilachna vigintioctopunctata]|uniref:Uncharacterized protein n=1 Tax=Henosepilachna vigintioctopunctata TaxID=420089 RepID=A0AAW1U861_9CUCU
MAPSIYEAASVYAEVDHITYKGTRLEHNELIPIVADSFCDQGSMARKRVVIKKFISHRRRKMAPGLTLIKHAEALDRFEEFQISSPKM